MLFNRSLNLQDMCLIAIVRDIDFFVNNKRTPQEHIDFLFWVYSDEIFSKYKALNGSIDENHMLWFLNPRVRKVNFLYKFCSERIIRQLQANVSGITSLNLKNSKATVKELSSIICCIPLVVHLDLSLTLCNDETLTCIKNFCPNLKYLNIAHCYVTDSGMGNLTYKSQLLLKGLNLLKNNISTLSMITVLNRMPSLECVRYEKLVTALRDFGNKKQYNLTEFEFSDNEYVPDSAFENVVKMCPKLKKLCFKNCCNKKNLSACVHLQNLEELKIKMTSRNLNKNWLLSCLLAPILPISKNLKTLILSYVKISPVNLIEGFKSLEKLYLKKVSFLPFEKKDIKTDNTNLHTLIIKDIDMEGATSEGVSLLISLSKNVTKLYLRHIEHLTPEIFDAILKSMKNLTLVNFDSVPMDMHYANSFFMIPLMTTVIMEKNISNAELFKKCCSCTLSWRSMPDFGYSNFDYSYFFYFDNNEDSSDNEESNNDRNNIYLLNRNDRDKNVINSGYSDSDSDSYSDVYIPGDDDLLYLEALEWENRL